MAVNGSYSPHLDGSTGPKLAKAKRWLRVMILRGRHPSRPTAPHLIPDQDHWRCGNLTHLFRLPPNMMSGSMKWFISAWGHVQTHAAHHVLQRKELRLPRSRHSADVGRRRSMRRSLCPLTGVSRQKLRCRSSPRSRSRRRHRYRGREQFCRFWSARVAAGLRASFLYAGRSA